MSTDQRPPSAGGVNGWSPEVGPGLEATVDLLATSPISVVGRLPWSSNLTFLVDLDDPGHGDGPVDGDRDGVDGSDGGEPGPAVLQAVYKPASGEQSLWDFPSGLYRREVAAYALSESLGWGLVPPTVERTDGPFGPGSLQLFVAADYGQHYFTLFDEGHHEDTLRTMCAFDVVANNADRTSGHVLLGAGDVLWGIDHGLCFHPNHKLRTVIWDFAGEEVPGPVVADLGRLASAWPDELARWLDQAEQDAVVERIERLVDAGTFPEPIGDRPPYPWPLV
jgi:uncharacterized repeat protein (TIGR03843 family)